MQSHASSKRKGYGHHDDTTYLPSHEKMDYHDVTQTYIERTPDHPSSRRASSRFSEAQRSIDQVIQMVSEKKRINEEAIEEVRHTNQEIVSHFSAYPPHKQSLYTTTRNRTAEQLYRDDSRNYVTTSQFEWRPAPSSDYDPKRSHKDSVTSHDNLELRSRLNEEIKKNNELMRHINHLEVQNASLRDSKAMNATQNATSLAEENRYLRSQLAASQVSVPYNVLDQLEKLKEENSHLRRDTVQLLKNSTPRP